MPIVSFNLIFKLPFLSTNMKLISLASAHKLRAKVRRFCCCLVSEVQNLTCFFQLISLLSFCLSLKTFVTVLCFVNFMMFCLPSLSVSPILWHLLTSFAVTLGSCQSLFIISIMEFVKDASVSFSQLQIPSITRHDWLEYCSWSSNFSFNTSVTWFAFLRGSYTVYRDVLENRQVGRVFELVNPKHEEQFKIFSKYFFLLFK